MDIQNILQYGIEYLLSLGYLRRYFLSILLAASVIIFLILLETIFLLRKQRNAQQNSQQKKWYTPVVIFLQVVFFPYFFPRLLFLLQQPLSLKILLLFLFVCFLLPLWTSAILSIATLMYMVLSIAGFVTIPIPTQGASMLPTIQENSQVFLKRFVHTSFYTPEIEKGDIVVFHNQQTAAALAKEKNKKGGFIKRVVGTAGDSVVIRDGFVYVNNHQVKEPYTLQPRSTFGGRSVKDCQTIAIPPDSVMVMGDNRKRSQDSRDIGLVALHDIEYYLPYSQQQTFEKRWRDTSGDAAIAHTSFLDVTEYIQLLNEKRTANNKKPLTYEPLLSQSAELRAKAMLTSDDLSFEATKSAYPMKQALRDVDYTNIIYAELPILGYYDAKELIDSMFEIPELSESLLNKDYQEIGVNTFIGDLHGCPVQIVVQHFGGYVPPNYKKEVVDSWQLLLTKLEEIQPGWQSLEGSGDFYSKHKTEIDRMNEIIEYRLSHIRPVVKQMQANQWLAQTDERFIEEDKSLSVEQNMLSEKINNFSP